jgi:probable rRNA maturation factor
LLGDVVISLDTASRVARAERRPMGDELDRYLVHGILHLLGFDHEEPGDARRMARAEDELLGADGMVAAAHVEAEPLPRAGPASASRSGSRSTSRSAGGSRQGAASRRSAARKRPGRA